MIQTTTQECYRHRQIVARAGKNEYQSHLCDLGIIRLLVEYPHPCLRAVSEL